MTASELLPLMAVVSGFLIMRIGEQRVHRANADFLAVVGGEELIHNAMRGYYTLNLLVILPAAAEGLLLRQPRTDLSQLLGIGLLLAGTGLRMWTVRTLGRFWTMRCIFVPGTPRVVSGPFRFVAHPEYLSRLGEIFGICLYLGAYFSALLYFVVAFKFLIFIVKIESRQLGELAWGTL